MTLSRLTATSDQSRISHSKWTGKSKFLLKASFKLAPQLTIGFRIVIAYCNLEFQAIMEDTPKLSYVFHIGKVNTEVQGFLEIN